jgi:hypothetical protein
MAARPAQRRLPIRVAVGLFTLSLIATALPAAVFAVEPARRDAASSPPGVRVVGGFSG